MFKNLKTAEFTGSIKRSAATDAKTKIIRTKIPLKAAFAEPFEPLNTDKSLDIEITFSKKKY